MDTPLIGYRVAWLYKGIAGNLEVLEVYETMPGKYTVRVIVKLDKTSRSPKEEVWGQSQYKSFLLRVKPYKLDRLMLLAVEETD